jgi:hypothetical protein
MQLMHCINFFAAGSLPGGEGEAEGRDRQEAGCSSQAAGRQLLRLITPTWWVSEVQCPPSL